MRTRKNINHSARTRPRLSTISDLITNSENTISSQATVISKQSHHLTPTQTQDRWGQLENYEDIISEQAEALRISPEEEKRIQSILELARKGKINPGNAFDVPVRVADPQLGEGQNMRFWKFASELLHTSMGIYDKRVEHVYLGTNRMFDNLIRVASNSPELDEPDTRENRKKGELMRIDISELANSESTAGYEIASVNCEERTKLNIKNSIMQFATDPLFSKRLKAFDSDSLKSLFLNVFQTGPNLEILFFHDSKAEKPQVQMDIESRPLLSTESHSQQTDEEESTKTEEVVPIPRFIQQDYTKLNLIAQNGSSFASLASLRKQTTRMGVGQEETLLKDFTADFSHFSSGSQRFQQKPQLISSIIENSQPLSFHHAEIDEVNTHFSLNFESHKQQSNSSQFHSEGYDKSDTHYFLSSAHQSSSAITPWEYQFNGLKLLKKRNLNRKKKGGKQPKKQKTQPIQYQINFLDRTKLEREDVFCLPKEQKPSRQLKYKQKYILPISYDATALALSQRVAINLQPHKSANIFHNPQHTQINESHLQHTQHPQERQVQYQSYQHPRMQIQQPQISSWERTAQNTMRNIRQLKQKVHERVIEMGEAYLSEIDFGMSPSSLLVVILHLVNEQKLEVVEETDSDIKLRGWAR